MSHADSVRAVSVTAFVSHVPSPAVTSSSSSYRLPELVELCPSQQQQPNGRPRARRLQTRRTFFAGDTTLRPCSQAQTHAGHWVAQPWPTARHAECASGTSGRNETLWRHAVTAGGPHTTSEASGSKTSGKPSPRGPRNVLGALACSALILANAGLDGGAAWANIPEGYKLPARPPTTNAQTLLLEALPVKSKPLYVMQTALQAMTTEGGGNIRSSVTKGSKGLGTNLDKKVAKAQTALTSGSAEIVAAVPSSRRDEARQIVDQMAGQLATLQEAVAKKDAQAVVATQTGLLKELSELESLMITEFPFRVPAEYAAMPQLLGRAVVECTLRYKDLGGNSRTGDMTLVVDGYSAPVTAGKFVDRVARKLYDSIKVDRVDELLVQTAANAELEDLPLEIMVRGDSVPVYAETLADAGRFRDQPALPFSAYGTVGMAHDQDDVNLSTAQIFFVKSDPVYNPAGLNILDGNFAVFAYVVKGTEVLDELHQGDVIESMRVVSGGENLINATS